MTVITESTASSMPSTRKSFASAPRHRHHANARIGTKLATDATPSRDSHDERHCENARQARCGWPRCRVEESRPAATNAAPIASASNASLGAIGKGSNTNTTPRRNSSPYPQPDMTVKKITEKAGFMKSAAKDGRYLILRSWMNA